MNAHNDDWALLQKLLRWFVALFGSPSAIARKRWMPRFLRNQALNFLRGYEAIARELLVHEALDAPRENARFRPNGFPSSTYRFGRGGFASDESADWGVSFRLCPAARHKHARRTRIKWKLTSAVVGACSLAERLEALLRVTRDPTRWARRLARRVRANPKAAPALLLRIIGYQTPSSPPPFRGRNEKGQRSKIKIKRNVCDSSP
jgi:hypothetical protein